MEIKGKEIYLNGGQAVGAAAAVRHEKINVQLKNNSLRK